jgi:cytidine kinase
MEDKRTQYSSTPALQHSVRLVVVGSIGIDTIRTPAERRENILGGSASYACAAASLFARTGMVGVVGTDFPQDYMDLYRRFGIDLAGLQVVEGRTFQWEGEYEANMDNRRTIRTDLNVFASFLPELPGAYRHAPFLFLANISPALQLHVLDQMDSLRFVVADTMDLWINNTRDDLLKVIARVNLLTLNESEARHLTGQHALLRAARSLLEMGPRHVLIKKGEHGSILFSRDRTFLMPAYPLETVQDPTGAGDSFAGGFMGALASMGDIDETAIRKAMLYGSIVASFGVEAFSLDRLAMLDQGQVEKRAALFREMLRCP